MAARSYLRAAGEKCRFVEIETGGGGGYAAGEDGAPGEEGPGAPYDALPPGLRHGDICCRGDSGSFVVVGDGRLARPIEDDAGYGVVPLEVSREIEDPVDFYADALAEFHGPGRIMMCPAAHQGLLRAAAGGRAVDPTRAVWWHAPDSCYKLLSPESPDIPGGTLVADLCPATPAAYLAAGARLDTDPTMERERRANQKAHGVRAHAYFLGLSPGTWLSGGAPGRGQPYPETLVRFKAAIPDAGDPGRAAAVRAEIRGLPAYLKPRVVAQTGPFGGVAVWATDGDYPLVIDLSHLRGSAAPWYRGDDAPC